VFKVWLDPKSPGGLWFGVERAIINPVVDGLFYHVVKHEGRITAASSASIAGARSSTRGSRKRRAGWKPS
jgi:hypothetical protein